jgi:hypothetical protein
MKRKDDDIKSEGLKKREVGGWILFFVGIFLVYTGFSSLFDYPLGDIRGIWEALFWFVPGGFAIWGGWRLFRSKPKTM